MNNILFIRKNILIFVFIVLMIIYVKLHLLIHKNGYIY